MKAEFKVGDVVKLTEYGHTIAKSEFQWSEAETLPIGSTAVIKTVLPYEGWENCEYIVEFFAQPGHEYGFYDGEIVSVHHR